MFAERLAGLGANGRIRMGQGLPAGRLSSLPGSEAGPGARMPEFCPGCTSDVMEPT